MGALDVVILVAFAVSAIVSGLLAREAASKNLEEYFLAGRTLRGWQAGFSMAATQFAADTPLLVTGLVATAGVFALWRLWIYALAFLLMGFVLAGPWRRARVLTDAELTELRYGGKAAAALRAFKAVYLGTVFNCAVLAMVLLAVTRIAQPFLTWNEWLPPSVFQPLVSISQAFGMPPGLPNLGPPGIEPAESGANNFLSILAIVSVTTMYSTTGGLRSVVRTDLTQLAVALIATVAFAVIAVQEAGGLWSLPERVAGIFGSARAESQLAFTPDLADVGTVALGVIAIQWLAQMNADGTGYLAQRSMACRSDADAKQAAVVFTLTQIVLRSLIWLPLALALLVVFPPELGLAGSADQATREGTFVRGMAELLPPGALGLMLTGMLAAVASTVDTHLNWGASYWTNDLYARFVYPYFQCLRGHPEKQPSPRTLVWVARLSNVAILFIALFVMTRLESIASAWRTSLLLGAGLGVILVLRWIWWRVSGRGEAASILTSLVLAPLLLSYTPDSAEGTRLLVMAILPATTGIGVSLILGPEPTERLREFYRRAHPPGFWGPIAAQEGHDPAVDRARLGRGVAAAGLAAFGSFCLLVGVGTWLCGSPAPSFFPSRALWIGANVLVGIVSLPVAWKLGFGSDGVRDRLAGQA